jgi:uncharacterized glyoxalase superfamily protein PhnB
MMSRDDKQSGALPPDANWLTPYLTVNDAAESLDFYERAFGFGRGECMADNEGRIVHAGMTWQGRSVVMFAPEEPDTSMRTPVHLGMEVPLSFYVYCADVDSLIRRAREAGATVLAEPEDMFWGDRIARVSDPDGYLWVFATRVGEFDASKVPEMEWSTAP